MSKKRWIDKYRKRPQIILVFLIIVALILGGCSAVAESLSDATNEMNSALEDANNNVKEAIEDAKEELKESGVADILSGKVSYYNTLEIENNKGVMKASGKISIREEGENELHLSDLQVNNGDVVHAELNLSRWYGDIKLIYKDINGEETVLADCTENEKKEIVSEISFQPPAGTGELLFRGNGKKAKYSFKLKFESK